MANKPILLITRDMPPLVEARAIENYTARLNREDEIYDAEGLIAAAEGVDALLTCGTKPLPRETFESLPKSVKIVACFTAGYDHVDLAAAEARNIVVQCA